MIKVGVGHRHGKVAGKDASGSNFLHRQPAEG